MKVSLAVNDQVYLLQMSVLCYCLQEHLPLILGLTALEASIKGHLLQLNLFKLGEKRCERLQICALHLTHIHVSQSHQ